MCYAFRDWRRRGCWKSTSSKDVYKRQARNKYPEITVEKILDAAQRLFLEKGYENTTIQDIVGELGGLTKGAVYHLSLIHIFTHI